MIAYIISLAMLCIAIWHDRRQDIPNLDAALDDLTDYDFDNNWWISSDGASALAIDSKKHKICLLRAYKGHQILDYRHLLEFELEEKKVRKPSSGIDSFFNSFFKSKSENKKIFISLLLDDLNMFDFTLNLYCGSSEKKIKQCKAQAKKLLKILKVVQKRAEKMEKAAYLSRSDDEYDYEPEDYIEEDTCSAKQTNFDFEPA